MMAMARWLRARRSALQHGRPVWAEPTMLAELHVLKFPVGIVGSPPADGRRARRPAKPANYIVVMMRCAGSGVVPRIVLSARRLGRADSVNQIGRLLRGQGQRRDAEGGAFGHVLAIGYKHGISWKSRGWGVWVERGGLRSWGR